MPFTKSLQGPSLALLVALLISATSNARADGPYPAHKVVDNIYYVGSNDLAIYLVTTPKGHMLINTGFDETVPLIQASVRSLGFKMTDIKIILASHAHADHVAGHARAREVSGAKVFVMTGDEKVIAGGGKGQYLYTDSRWRPCPVDKVLKDGEKVTLGGTTLVARHTPGHTPGCTTWTAKVTDGKSKKLVVVVGSPNVNPGYQLVKNKAYPKIAKDFARTFKVLNSLKCDYFLGAHGNYYGMHAKYPKLKGAKVSPFIDPAGYRDYISLKEKAFRDTLAAQKKASPKK
ncbi:MAG TPA: subclass B3 metallo-beta-lactamase [Planctomycetaceae bacterium]|nr:subclass B3 metallo-beta-lactamase [Planctomycetaceae bacterium]|tara:strand:- start:97 stop:963 length:867 start_codon:yes stop_codon:yes gene_type:complete